MRPGSPQLPTNAAAAPWRTWQTQRW